MPAKVINGQSERAVRVRIRMKVPTQPMLAAVEKTKLPSPPQFPPNHLCNCK